VEQTREPEARPSPPPPLEANDELVTRVITAGWAVALVVLLIIHGSLRPDVRWWIWTCVAGLALGLFGLWYLPRLKRARAQSVPDQPTPDQSAPDQSAPRDNGSKTVSSTDTPGKSTRS
jgi:Protein of unknown function (DUF2530)